MTDDVREYWDAQAESFDEEADHGLADPVVRQAWEALLLPLIPRPGSAVADLGCGTGTLSLLLGGAGHRVQGVDLSGNMVDIARAKAARAGIAAEFVVGDASLPPLPPASFDVVLGRHVLWALPDPDAAVEHWVRLLRPAGSMIFVEGLWGTGAGIPAERCLELVRRHRREATVTLLTAPDLWGREITDERYLIVSPA
ncbi:class I SAM-dependent methyltransferase [Pseudarthrobacter phenanthrenivorans]|uniref:class I SAM-dependent methyltransferase n=1 Tax=Pseudarthrobacter phenanthrenivorans TaxID=361575 RepID=UPI00112794EA|nr:class I SAM-dependent methyltransferase [Pseudarthrobacter phenanthrenivorans]TPV52497.1 class I SAM-dependent methyltransferase [Pseudarthrobacter phenanthrenivorans]